METWEQIVEAHQWGEIVRKLGAAEDGLKLSQALAAEWPSDQGLAETIVRLDERCEQLRRSLRFLSRVN